MEIWFCMHVSASVKLHEKKFFKCFWKQNGGVESLANKSIFWTASSAGHNFAPRTKNEKDSENKHRRIFSKFRFFEKWRQL